MRFLIFNAVVIAALFYLFNADKDDIASVADRAHAVVARAQDAASTAAERVQELSKTEQLRQRLQDFSKAGDTDMVDEPETAAKEAVTEMPAEVITENAEQPLPPQPPAPEETGTKAPQTGTRLAAAGDTAQDPLQEIPERWIPERPRHTVDHAAAEAAIPEVPTDDPAVAKRRAEILDGVAETPPAKNGAEIAIADGESLMTPRERRKELHNLAEDMELVYIRKLGR
ncbi:MAG: hypothetical protein MI741_20230 [Rhodospirillales bacterium]|nr:hypothetical protein [Rhodospirillales bacterium]